MSEKKYSFANIITRVDDAMFMDVVISYWYVVNKFE